MVMIGHGYFSLETDERMIGEKSLPTSSSNYEEKSKKECMHRMLFLKIIFHAKYYITFVTIR